MWEIEGNTGAEWFSLFDIRLAALTMNYEHKNRNIILQNVSMQHECLESVSIPKPSHTTLGTSAASSVISDSDGFGLRC